MTKLKFENERELQLTFASILKFQGWRVEVQKHLFNGSQIDIYATRGNDELFVECKMLKRDTRQKNAVLHGAVGQVKTYERLFNRVKNKNTVLMVCIPANIATKQMKNDLGKMGVVLHEL